MSKQNVSKGNPAVRPPGGNEAKGTPNRAPTKSGASPSASKNYATSTRPAPGTSSARATNRQSVGRAAQTPVKRKTGFRLRPLDIALLLTGALVVVFIVMSALQAPMTQVNSNAQITASGTPLALASNAPDFNLPSVDGNTYSLSAQKGKVVVLEFMATWCPHCQADAPMMNQLDAAYKSKNVQIFGVNATPYGHDHTSPVKASDLQWFHDNYSVTFPLLFDKDLKSANDYQVVSYPTIYMVDQQGKIAFQPPTDSIPDLTQLSAQLDKLLAAK
jgi:peroxiredoxin